MFFSQEVSAVRPFGKYRTLKNWLAYNWGWIALAVLAVLFVLYTTLLQPAQPDPDYRISWVGASALSGQEEQALCAALANLGKDENGDGRVTVAVTQYRVDFTLTNRDQGFEDNYASVLKLLAELQQGSCYLFLMDEPEQFQRSTGVLQYLDGAVPSAAQEGYESENWERMCVPFKAEGFDRAAWLGRRCVFGDRTAAELYPGAEELFAAVAARS